MNQFDNREDLGYDENFDMSDETISNEMVSDDIANFLSRYTVFVDMVDGSLSPSDTITLFGIYMHTQEMIDHD